MQNQDKKSLLKQYSKAIWITGLPCSGKTSISIALKKKLSKEGFFSVILDGDVIRKGINNDLNFSEKDRIENIRRVAEISKIFINNNVITINAFISPTENIRNMAAKIIGKDNFIEIFVNCPVEICEKRDVKGLYKKARNGEIKNFTGIDSVYENPVNPDLIINTDKLSIDDSVNKIYEFIKNIIKLNYK
ncbi:MAG: adenylyl-sulfate kinase [Bacteroidales bacterium]|nr:adenylyl-sulfate kinase [Bacteroidales bacterium]